MDLILVLIPRVREVTNLNEGYNKCTTTTVNLEDQTQFFETNIIFMVTGQPSYSDIIRFIFQEKNRRCRIG